MARSCELSECRERRATQQATPPLSEEAQRLQAVQDATDAFINALVQPGQSEDADARLATQQWIHAQARRAADEVMQGMRESKKKQKLEVGKHKSKWLQIGHYNMARLTKVQLQLLAERGFDAIVFTEVWDTAVPLADWNGTNQFIPAGKPRKGDPAGAVAVWQTKEMAAKMQTWGVVEGAGPRAMYVQWGTADGWPVRVYGVYVCPDYGDQQTTITAVNAHIVAQPDYIRILLLGDLNAQFTRNVPNVTGN